jgi:hypothetical protein
VSTPFVLDAERLTTENMIQVLVETCGVNGYNAEPFGDPIPADRVTGFELRFPGGKSLLFDFEEGEILVQDMETGTLIASDEGLLVDAGMAYNR